MMSWNLTSKKFPTETEYGVWKLLSYSFTNQSQNFFFQFSAQNFWVQNWPKFFFIKQSGYGEQTLFYKEISFIIEKYLFWFRNSWSLGIIPIISTL